MRTYGVTRNIRSEIKINGAVALQDVAIYVVIGLIAIMLSSVFPPTEKNTKMIFFVVMGAFAVWLTMKPTSNPFKRNYQIMLFMLKKKQHYFLSFNDDYDDELIPNLRIRDAGKFYNEKLRIARFKR